MTGIPESHVVPPPSPNLPVVGAAHMPIANLKIESGCSLTKYQHRDTTTSATTMQASLSTYASEFLGNLSPPTVTLSDRTCVISHTNGICCLRYTFDL